MEQAFLYELLAKSRQLRCSDLHLTKGLPPLIRVNGKLQPMPETVALNAQEIEQLSDYLRAGAGFEAPSARVEDQDFCFVDRQNMRYRVNCYRQQDSPAVAVRLLSEKIPTMEELGLPPVVERFAALPRGLILVTGPTGSGKSTTLASIIDRINCSRSCHILTLEDPVEYRHTHKNCMVNQREVGRDTSNFADALRSALREDPDVILVGEMRDLETIAAAVTAAETGHLVLSTLHTTGAAATIDRIVDIFPPYQQQQIRTQLAMVLRGVVSQQLIPLRNGSGRVAALEVLTVTDAASNMIRENKCHQLATLLQTGAKSGMQSMDMHLATLCREGKISLEDALERSIDREMLKRLAASMPG